MRTIGYATTDLGPLAESDPDEELLRAALARRGVDLPVGRWRDSDVEWSACDLVLIRSVWDYHHHLDEFLRWLSEVDAVTEVVNPAEVIRWNLDKSYLGRLGDAGVPVVPTGYCSDPGEVVDALARFADTSVVVKPTVSAGSTDTGLFESGDDRAMELARRILDRGRRVMVQPAIESVETAGEVAAVCIGERPLHWVRKGPILRAGGGFRGGRYTETVERIDPPAAAMDLVELALDAIGVVRAERGEDRPLVYARLDLVALDDGTFAMLEAELFEPSLFLRYGPGTVDRLAEVLEERVS